jgi:subtilisin
MRYARIVTFLLVVVLLLAGSGPVFAGSNKTTRVLIGLKSGVTNSDRVTLQRQGGSIKRTFHMLNAIAAEVPEAAIPFIRALKAVSYIESDSQVQAVDNLASSGADEEYINTVRAASQTVPWGIQAVKAPAVQAYNQGQGVRVAVIDTGIDLSHPDLRVAGNVNILSPAKTGNDNNGHGTHVAGTLAALNNDFGVLGVAPQIDLFAVKVLDSNGSGYWSDVIEGLEWAVDNHMNIINLSLGSTSGSTALKQACDNAYNAGVLIVAAAGNNGVSSLKADNVIYPAKYDSVIAVGAVNSAMQRPNFSSVGVSVELAAPGVEIFSTYKGSAYTTLQGTSMASPHVAGVAALVFASGIQDNDQDGRLNDEVRQRLQETAGDLGTSGRDSYFGYGLVDAAKAVPQTANHAPVAEAGPDQSGFVNNRITLDGSGSSDQDGDVLTYSWSQSAGAAVSLEENTTAYPFFSPLTPGAYVFSLVVNDGTVSSQPDAVTVTIRHLNSAPGAPLVAISPSEPLTADNLVCHIITGSTDPDNDTVSYSYAWYRDAVLQPGLTTEVVAAKFTQKGEIWSCQVTPSDGLINGPAGVSEVTIGNTPPTANAGPDQNALIDSQIKLSGAGSNDIDGDSLNWAWAQTSGPVDVQLSAVAAVNPTFTTGIPGRYVFELTVTDSSLASDSDSVTVNVSAVPTNVLHCQNIQMSLADLYGGFRTSATAQLTIMDEFGNPVSGVTVSGHWASAASNKTSGKTNTSGRVTLSSTTLRYPSSGTLYIFVLDSLSKDGYSYDAAANEQNSGVVAVP